MGQFDPLLTSREFAQSPYPTYHLLRREAPIYWSDLWGCWILTRYRDIVSTLQNPRRFSSVGRLTAAMELPQDVREQVRPLVRHYSQGLINVDPPDHTRLRQLVHKAFLPGTVGAMAGYVEGIVERLIDEVQPRGKMDIIWDFAYPLPVTVIARLMGIPPADHGKLKRWSGKIVEFMATPKPVPEVLMSSQDALLALQDYFRSTFRRRRLEPGDDLISALVAAEEAGERLTEEELISTCVTLLIGGHETTTYPDLQRSAGSDPTPGTVAEAEGQSGWGQDGGRRDVALRGTLPAQPPPRHRGGGVGRPPHSKGSTGGTNAGCGQPGPGRFPKPGLIRY